MLYNLVLFIESMATKCSAKVTEGYRKHADCGLLPQGLRLFSIAGVQSVFLLHGKSSGEVHHCTGTEALYRPYGP